MAVRGTKTHGFPEFKQSNVYPLRERTSSSIKPTSEMRDIGSKAIDSNVVRKKQLAHNNPHAAALSGIAYTTHRVPRSCSFSDLDHLLTKNPTSEIPNPNTTNQSSEKASQVEMQTQSPINHGVSPSRKQQQVFQEAGDRTDRVASLVQSMEDEMHKSGVNVNFSKLKEHLTQLRDNESELPPNFDLEGELVEVDCNSPRHHANSKIQSGISEMKKAQPLEAGAA